MWYSGKKKQRKKQGTVPKKKRGFYLGHKETKAAFLDGKKNQQWVSAHGQK